MEGEFGEEKSRTASIHLSSPSPSPFCPSWMFHTQPEIQSGRLDNYNNADRADDRLLFKDLTPFCLFPLFELECTSSPCSSHFGKIILVLSHSSRL